MSRYYAMTAIVKWKPQPKENIQQTAARIADEMNREWEFDDIDPDSVERIPDGLVRLIASGESTLCGGESEDEFAARLAQAIWKVAPGVHVRVDAGCLEYVPVDTYEFGEAEYEEWKNSHV